jgi:hypothetical protein
MMSREDYIILLKESAKKISTTRTSIQELANACGKTKYALQHILKRYKIKNSDIGIKIKHRGKNNREDWIEIFNKKPPEVTTKEELSNLMGISIKKFDKILWSHHITLEEIGLQKGLRKKYVNLLSEAADKLDDKRYPSIQELADKCGKTKYAVSHILTRYKIKHKDIGLKNFSNNRGLSKEEWVYFLNATKTCGRRTKENLAKAAGLTTSDIDKICSNHRITNKEIRIVTPSFKEFLLFPDQTEVLKEQYSEFYKILEEDPDTKMIKKSCKPSLDEERTHSGACLLDIISA